MANDEPDEEVGRDDEFGYEEVTAESGTASDDDGVGPPEGIDDRSRPTPGPQPEGDPIAPDRERREPPGRAAAGRRRIGRITSGIAALLGAWVALSALVYGMDAAALWNNVLVGAVIFLGAGYEYYRGLTASPPSLGAAGLIALLGIWLIVAVAVLGLSGGAAWSTAISGLLVAALAGYTLYEARGERAGIDGETGTQ